MALTPVKNNTPSLNSVLQSNPGDRISTGKGEILPIVAVMSRQLPLPQAQQLAGQTVLVKVLKSGPGPEAELEFNGQNIPVKLPQGKQLTAGEMITVNFALSEKGDPQTTKEAGGTKKAVNLNNLLSIDAENDGEGDDSPSFVNKLSNPAKLIGFLDRVKTQTTPIAANTMRSMEQLVATARNVRDATQSAMQVTTKEGGQATQALMKADITQLSKDITSTLAKQVSSAVENSGLFYESHLQEWANGQRTKEQLALEPQAKFNHQQVISDKNIDPTALNQSVKMVNNQLAVLDHGKISLALGGLMNMPVEIEIQPDTHDQPQNQNAEQDEAAAQPWVARLKLNMPQLGDLEVRVRMLGSNCDVNVKAGPVGKKALDAHWVEFQTALDGKGVKLRHGQITHSGESEIG